MESQDRRLTQIILFLIMDRNTVIGIILIFGLFYLWAQINAPTQEELAERKRLQDSIEMLEQADPQSESTGVGNDSSASAPGDVTPAKDTVGVEIEKKLFNLSNPDLGLSISNLGGYIQEAKIKGYDRVVVDENGEEQYAPLSLMNDPQHKYEYIIPKAGGGYINTADLVFDAEQVSDRVLEMQAQLPQGGQISFQYVLAEKGYAIDFQTSFSGLDNYIQPQGSIQFNWVTVLQRHEKPDGYEETYTTVHYKLAEESPTSLSWTADDSENIEDKMNWVSHANQFFNSTFMSQAAYPGGQMDIQNLENEPDKLKIARTSLVHEIANPKSGQIDQKMYIGPNDFEAMTAMGQELEDVIP